METNIQFKIKNQKDPGNLRDLFGNYVIFRVQELESEESKPKLLTSTFFQTQMKAEWNWLEERCVICYGQIKSDSHELIWKCPHCGKVAHHTHVETWIQRKHKCPVCRQPVSL